MSEYILRPIVKKRVEKNILIVEDEEDTAEAIWINLLTEGYGVRVCKNRDEAASQLLRNIYHFILLDFHMQGKTAEDFIEDTKRFSPISKIVLMTASSQASKIAHKLGLKYWIGKPIDPEQLLKALDEF